MLLKFCIKIECGKKRWLLYWQEFTRKLKRIVNWIVVQISLRLNKKKKKEIIQPYAPVSSFNNYYYYDGLKRNQWRCEVTKKKHKTFFYIYRKTLRLNLRYDSKAAIISLKLENEDGMTTPSKKRMTSRCKSPHNSRDGENGSIATMRHVFCTNVEWKSIGNNTCRQVNHFSS